MTTFVLVHGAWSGAHGFRKLRPLLRQEGHDVYTPSLTGIGERSHLANPQLNLTTHIQDVVNTILYEDLEQIVLLGFSYGGMVVTGALPHIHERVAHLVFLDALVPSDGESANNLRGRESNSQLSLGQPWYMEPVSRRFDNPEEADWYGIRRSPQPLASFSEGVSVPMELNQYNIRLTYIKATQDEAESRDSAFWQAAQRAREDERWGYFEIATNHIVPINRPNELADILLGLES